MTLIQAIKRAVKLTKNTDGRYAAWIKRYKPGQKGWMCGLYDPPEDAMRIRWDKEIFRTNKEFEKWLRNYLKEEIENVSER